MRWCTHTRTHSHTQLPTYPPTQPLPTHTETHTLGGLGGDQSPTHAHQAEEILRAALTQSTFKPKVLITGGADGVDGVALRLRDSPPYPNYAVKGWYTPTPFARADLGEPPLDLTGLEPGPAPLNPPNMDAASMPVPEPGAPEFMEFLAMMEGQWEARDTMDAEEADAVIAFLSTGKPKTNHDGTKATLNIFTEGRYAHPLASGTFGWEAEPQGRSPGVVELPGKPEADTKCVCYKLVTMNSSDNNNGPASEPTDQVMLGPQVIHQRTSQQTSSLNLHN